MAWNRLVAAGFLLLLAACGGSQGTLTPLPSPSSALQSGTGVATFTIHIPNATTASAVRRPAFVSPSTKSITIAAVGSGVPNVTLMANLSPGSPGCVTGANGTTCTISQPIARGTYTGTVTTFDALNGAGKALSVVNVPFTIAQGTANSFSFVLNGIPSGFTVAGAGISGSMSSGFILSTTSATTATMTALDPDGNTIVGSGVPTVSATVGTGWTITPTATPGTFTITPPAVNNTGTTLAFTATSPACSQSGAVCSATAAMETTPLVFVSNGSNTVAEFLAPFTSSSTPVATLTTGALNAGPIDMIFDASKNLLVLNTNTGTVAKFLGPGFGSSSTPITGGVTPFRLMLDGSGNLYIVDGQSNGGGGSIDVFSPSLVSTATIRTGISFPVAEAFDSSGNLWVVNCGGCGGSPGSGGTVTEYSPPFSSSSVPVLTLGPAKNGINDPFGLAFDAAGNLFIINGGFNGAGTATNNLIKLTPPFSNASTPSATLTSSTNLGEPNAIRVNAAGDVFVYNFGGAAVPLPVVEYNAPVTSASTATVLALAGGATTTGGNSDVPISFDANGNAYVVVSNGLQIFAPPYTHAPFVTLSNGISQPEGVATLP